MKQAFFTIYQMFKSSNSWSGMTVRSRQYGILVCFFFISQILQAQTCPGGLGTTVNIASLPYNGTGLTTCGAGNEITSSNATVCGSSSYYGGEDLVFIFTPTSSGSYIITETSTSSWIGLMLYNGCPFLGQGGTCVGNTQSSTGSKTLTVTLTAGVTYYLVVDTWPTPTCIPSFSLSIAAAPAPPSNDNCATATPFPTIPTDGTCATLSNQSTVSATNSNVTPTGACTSNSGTPDDDVWFSFVAPASSVILQGTFVSGVTDVYWQVFSSSCGSSMTSVLCTDTDAGGTLTGLTVGATYYIRLYTWSSGVSTVQNICLKTPPLPPSNDDCANATNLVSNVNCVTTSGTNAAATQSIAPITCAGFTSSSALDVWYSFVATSTTHTVTVVGGTGFDAIIDVRSGACNGTNIGCADATTSAGTETTTVSGLTIGQTYYVRVYGWAGGTGTFTICVTNPAPPVVLTCPTNTTVASCQTQAAVNAAFAAWLATASGTGGCSGVLTNDNTGGPSACGGSTTVTFTYTSTCAPLTSTCQATYTVDAPPTVVLTCPTNTTVASCQTQADVNSAFASWLATASASGGCNGVLTNNNTGAPSACGGSTTVTFTYISSCAPTTTTCQATFTVSAPPPVVLTCPNNLTVAAGQTQTQVDAQFAAWLATASASGGCNGVLTNDNTGAPDATLGGTATVIFTYTSSCAPLTTTCTATFTVATGPTVILTCPTNTTVASCLTQAAVNTAFNAWLATAAASGGCNGVLTNNNTGAPAACGGSTTVTFTFTSTCAPLTTTCQATFTVSAPPPVVLTCPTNTTTASCQTQAAVNTAFAAWLATASATGGCNGVLTNNNTGAPSACGGSTTVTFTYPSACAPFTTTCQATFTVAAPPTVVLTCPVPTTASACLTQTQLDAAYNAWLASATASGGCNGVLTNNSTGAPLICSATAVTKTVTFTYTSSCAPTTSTCTSTFTVPAYPNFTVPANGASQVACPVNATQPTPPTVLDACGKTLAPSAPVITNNPNPISCEGTRTYAFTFTDCAGHAQTWSYVYTIERNDFTVPANGASQVACPAAIVQPTPPTVLSNCGETITPTGPVITNSPATITCEGTRTYTWTYTDCEGNTHPWSHVVTVERQPFTVPASGGTTVACPAQTNTQPVPPTVTSNCGEVLTPVVTSTQLPGCEGSRVWYFTYTDCEGNTATWNFMYTVEYLDFTVPASETATVGCASAIVVPTPPTVNDNCGNQLTPSGPVITKSNNNSGCEGSRKYTWTYKDCEGNTHTWSKTFTINYTADFFVYPDGEDFVGCLLFAQPPVPPTIYDYCGNVIAVSGPTVTGDVNNCSGTRKYTYVYTDCGGHSHPWSFTYHAADNEPPVGDCNGNFDVTNLACIGDVPCAGSYDFGPKIHEMLNSGDFQDLCSGNNLVIELDSWSELWQCSDPDGDGVNTYGRTFYFRIADQCGNEMPSLCGVTYSGVCQPLETFNQDEWGNEGGEPGASTPGAFNDAQTIQSLLNMGPFKIGGANRSITLTNASCVQALVPGVGNPAVLGNCNQVDCANGCNPAGPIGMKNVLATNTISLLLNMRFNVTYHNLTMANIRNQSLNCIGIDPNIKVCDENGGCKLRLFDNSGVVYEFPYNLGGLLDMANLFLNGLPLTDGSSSVYANAINKSVANANEYWHNGQTATNCNQSAGTADVKGSDPAAKVNTTAKAQDGKGFSLAPNPASSELNFKLAEMPEAQKVTLEVFNQLGQLVLRTDYGFVSYLNERISLGNIGNGLYTVRVMAGSERFEQKLVVAKN